MVDELVGSMNDPEQGEDNRWRAVPQARNDDRTRPMVIGIRKVVAKTFEST